MPTTLDFININVTNAPVGRAKLGIPNWATTPVPPPPPAPPTPQISFGHGPPVLPLPTDPHIYFDIDSGGQYNFANGAIIN